MVRKEIPSLSFATIYKNIKTFLDAGMLRAGMQFGLGIHKDQLLPEFHGELFEEWYRKQPTPAGDPTKAVLFSTCFVNYNHPDLGKDLIEVFSRNAIALGLLKQNCSGMPAMEAGDIELAKRLARQNVEALLPSVREGKKVLAVNPTCSYMMRKEYGELVGTPEARRVTAATMDPCEFLFQLKQEGKFNIFHNLTLYFPHRVSPILP